ncbi:MAG: hypothetical protein WBI07_06945 [Mobilitalea sp.]
MFGVNRIKVKKEISEDNVKFFVDYFKSKKPKEFVIELMKDLIGEKYFLLVIDTKLSYNKLKVSAESELKELTERLDEQAISYRQVTTKSDSTRNALGLPLNFGKEDKIKNYVVGLVVAAEDYNKISSILVKHNALCYILSETVIPEEALEQFDKINGDTDELNEMFGSYIYVDSYFSHVNIITEKSKSAFIEEILQKHIQEK